MRQFCKHGLQRLPPVALRVQKKPVSIVRQSEEQPSPLTVLWSSHASTAELVMPSPQRVTQVLLAATLYPFVQLMQVMPIATELLGLQAKQKAIRLQSPVQAGIELLDVKYVKPV